MRDPVIRFMQYVTIGDGCWLWTGSKSPDGYGKFWAEGRTHNAHRWYYERMVAPIEAPLEMDHLCRVKACVNPSHLEVVTHKENIARTPKGLRGAHEARKTHCPQGHPYEGWNLIRNHQGGRHCRTCMYARSRERDLRIGRTDHS